MLRDESNSPPTSLLLLGVVWYGIAWLASLAAVKCACRYIFGTVNGPLGDVETCPAGRHTRTGRRLARRRRSSLG